MDLTNIKRISADLHSVILSIIHRSGSTLSDLAIDTSLSETKIENIIDPLMEKGKIKKADNGKYFVEWKDEWQFWKERIEFIDENDRLETRSLWLEESPVKDWWPSLEQPKPGLVYFIGPFREPYLSLYSILIKPLVQKMGFVCMTSLEEPGSKEFLRSKILPGLKSARYVLCDLSESNPNVHYEFGWLHAFGTPFLAFKSDLTKDRAADVHQLTINSYKFTERGLVELGESILDDMIDHQIIAKNIKPELMTFLTTLTINKIVSKTVSGLDSSYLERELTKFYKVIIGKHPYYESHWANQNAFEDTHNIAMYIGTVFDIKIFDSNIDGFKKLNSWIPEIENFAQLRAEILLLNEWFEDPYKTGRLFTRAVNSNKPDTVKLSEEAISSFPSLIQMKLRDFEKTVNEALFHLFEVKTKIKKYFGKD